MIAAVAPPSWPCRLSAAARRTLAITLALTALAAAAAGTCADFLKALALRESSGDPRALNSYGYVGLWQMGEAALIDAGFYRRDGTGANDWAGSWTGLRGVDSLEDFRNDPAAQAAAVTAYHQRVWGYIRSLGLDRYLGRTIGGVEMTRSGLIAAAHLVGSGNLRRFLDSNGQVVPRDGNGTPLSEYLARFGGYGITGFGANCADWARGVPTGGLVAVVPPPPAPGKPIPRPYGPELVGGTLNPAQAYYAGAGHSPEQVDLLLKLLTASLLLLIAAACSLGVWWLYASGRTTLQRFVHDHKRLFIVVALLIVVLS